MDPSENPQGVDPSLASAVQIQLQDFSIPAFPPEASGIKELRLTSDIKLDEYETLLKDYATIPQLPASIESVVLELFSLGYPPGFLRALSQQLPHLHSLTVYSQLLAGISEDSRKDAEAFFEHAAGLRALHLLDTFARLGFFDAVGKTLSARDDGLRFLEVNYTFRHEDEDFLTRVPAPELPSLIGPSLVTCAFNIADPDVTDDPDDPSNLTSEGEEKPAAPQGVMALHHTLSPELVDALVGDRAPRGLRALNTTLFTLTLEQLRSVLEKHRGLLMLSATVTLQPGEDWKREVLEILALCPTLEQVELVGNPSLEFYMAMTNPKRQEETMRRTFPSAEDMATLSGKCTRLASFSADILRVKNLGRVDWLRRGDDKPWEGGVTIPVSAEAQPPPPMLVRTEVSAGGSISAIE